MRMYNKVAYFLIALFFFLTHSFESYSQSTGLRFSGQEVVLDKRTSLDLSAGNGICLNKDFEIAFDISFPPNQKDYFGYILRIINDKDQNVDLIYDQKRTNSNNFKVITGKKFSNIAFRLDTNQLFKQWNSFSIKFSLASHKIIFKYNGVELVENNIGLVSPGCFKFLFGANDYKQFKTTDVPPMNISNIRIYEGDKLKNRWKLDDIAGISTKDDVNDHEATVTNPTWIRSQHTKWQFVKKRTVQGKASVAFNEREDILYIVGSDSLYRYSVKDGSFASVSYDRIHNLPPGNQSVYDNYSRKLVNIYPDQKKVLFFNEKTRKWSSEFVYPTTLTEFWHTNKFVSAVDSSIYVVGGYGQLTYKNKVQRYHKPSEKWEEISTNGDTLAPRYLAALGAGPRGTVYIIGGYGSLTGQQMLSPQNYYDLLTYDVKTRKFTRLYEFENIEQDFAFVNSLVIDKSSNTFYGLVFPNNKYNSQLQLLKGRLDKPEYEFAGDKIPYEFHDIESFADLFYSPGSKKLIAVTLFFRKNDVTDVKIYSLHFPPGKIENQAVSKKSMAYMFLIGIVIVALCIPVVFLLKRKRGEKRKQEASMANDPQDDFPLPLGDNVLPVERSIAIAGRSSILLFGQLQVFDAEGNDITKLFTPLVKELLLVIIIYTIRRERGVSSEKLNELLWYDKSEKDARNNRSVNIAKLKSILEKVGCGHISKETGYWKLELSADGIFIDYQQYVNIIKRRANLDKSFVEELITIIQRGSLLENTDYEWLDDLKSEVSDEIINILLAYANETGIEKDPEFLIRLMNYVFYFDNVNEEAMLIKCKALVLLGKHTLAHHSFEKFKKDYHALYGEEYELSFPEIVDFKE